MSKTRYPSKRHHGVSPSFSEIQNRAEIELLAHGAVTARHGAKSFSTTTYSDADVDRMFDDARTASGFQNEPAPWTGKEKYNGGRCAHTHPGLKIKGIDGKDYVVYGGACSDPIHDDLDIYVALDHGTAHDKRAYPWHGTREFVYFPINDMSVPKDEAEFKLMIEWLCTQIMAGKRVHIGCIGGHGRTGMVLAAIAKVLGGIEDAVTYVRNHYCQKAVETSTQSKWLHDVFNTTLTKGHKSDIDYYSGKYKKSSGWGNKVPKADTRAKQLFEEYGHKMEEVKPFRFPGNIWGVTE